MAPSGREVHRSTTRVLSGVMVVIGVILIVQTIAVGGGVASARMILGVLFVLAGAGRIYLTLPRGPAGRAG